MSTYTTLDGPELTTEASLEELKRFAGGEKRVCGNCRHFCHGEGQIKIRDQKFIDQIVKEHGWALYQLGSDPSELGICAQYESGANGTGGTGSLITGPLHDAMKCAGYKPRNGAIGKGL